MSESAWRTVSLPTALLDEVNSFIQIRPDYRSISEFIREAVRARLRKLTLEALRAKIPS